MTAAVSLVPAGLFSLASGIRFLECFTPAGYDHAADGILRLAFPADDSTSVVAAAVRQEAGTGGGTGTVRAEFTVHPAAPAPAEAATAEAADDEAVRAQLARILSLDVDGTGFPALAADPVVAGLMADYPGLRPVCFYSPYEAAAWAVIGNRIRVAQAAVFKARIARRHGQGVHIAGQTLYAFPTPAVLRTITHVPGLTDIKIQRLHALAEAALDGQLDAARLRALPSDYALAELRSLPGIGPFSAELVLIRGAGHPDVFPRHEPRVHRAIATAYGLDGPAAADVSGLAEIADRWRPYRSWIATLLRTRAAEGTAMPVPHGSGPGRARWAAEPAITRAAPR
ncbi:Fe-S cluster assembly protein HesB [Streptomyces sp. CB02923]|nr:Fe-S cluster assembly protein HesB [Streptomyces sp. CB02923]